MPGTPKQFNTHKWPDANHQPRQKAGDRKLNSEARQSVYDELTLEQKIAALPPEPFSAKQRARLLAKLEKQNAPKAEPKNVAPKAEASENVTEVKTQPKKYMKGSK
jgi:hypothetical protein